MSPPISGTFSHGMIKPDTKLHLKEGARVVFHLEETSDKAEKICDGSEGGLFIMEDGKCRPYSPSEFGKLTESQKRAGEELKRLTAIIRSQLNLKDWKFSREETYERR